MYLGKGTVVLIRPAQTFYERIINGFPVPYYPMCLQKAHENAALVDFDRDMLQDYIYEGVRESLGADAGVLDAFHLQDSDPAQKRYG